MVSSESTIDVGLKAISDTTRRQILGLLKRRQLSVLEIAEEFPMSRPAISKHLRILKEAGLVLETPAGRKRLYALEKTPLEPLMAWIADLSGGGTVDRSAGVRVLPTRGRRRVTSLRPPSRQDDWRVW